MFHRITRRTTLVHQTIFITSGLKQQSVPTWIHQFAKGKRSRTAVARAFILNVVHDETVGGERTRAGYELSADFTAFSCGCAFLGGVTPNRKQGQDGLERIVER
eukprot:8829349-Ditylum_brightwellii.AAC.1